ncbi:MAG TPA: hypothetical protein VGK74_12885 [Symbiobacteriaceae bacterium]
MRTNAKVLAYKENIFAPTDIELSIDAADVNERTVKQITLDQVVGCMVEPEMQCGGPGRPLARHVPEDR